MQTPAGSNTGSREGILILGVGNPLRCDDGIGVRAVARLQELPLPEGVSVLDGGIGGIDLLEQMRPFAQVILLDAVRTQGLSAAGEVLVFRLSHVELRNPDPQFSLHDTSLGAIFRLARALGIPLPEITVVGVIPAAVGWGTELSPEGRVGLEGMLREVHRLLSTVCSTA